MDEYNYSSFPLSEDVFERFPAIRKVGTPAPDGELTDANTGRRVRLSDYWRSGPVVIEFGSIT